MKFGSVCSGIEAASVAWEPLGWKAAWFSEIEPFPCAVLKHHYPDVPNLGDMTTLSDRILSGEVEAPDLFCGGTPCQAFSIAGLRKSLDDARGNLSLIFCEIANAIDTTRSVRGEQPCIVFWENVPGVLNTKDNAFGCFLGALAGSDTAIVPSGGRWSDAGVVAGPQRTVAWRTLDAQYFGVAQRRRRVFVVASAREGFDPAAVLLEFDGVRLDSAPSRETGEAVAPCVTNGPPFSRTGNQRVEADAMVAVAETYSTPAIGYLVKDEVANCITKNTGAGGETQNPAFVVQPCIAWDEEMNASVEQAGTLLRGGKGGRHDGVMQPVAHTLRGEGFDASEDGTGRWTPLVPVVHCDTMPTLRAGAPNGNRDGMGVGAVAVHVGVTLHGTDGTAQVASYTEVSSSLRARIPSGVENSTTTAVMCPVVFKINTQ
ncbi:MAG: DNA cytosine methyltransferase, partial [Rhodobacteraceae bacterium]|nr:DNA cytosine methyltransferase [Paracoccaceae bacterium]